MGSLRTFFRDHRRVAALLIALALVVKALVPAGYMVGQQDRVLTIELCADTLGAKVTKQIVIAHQAQPGAALGDHGKTADACPFTGLAMASLSGADAVLLTLALAFILALGFMSMRAAPLRHAHHVRPPLRGPPALS